MVKLTKIYTRTGDHGETHLAGGHRVAKTSLRIQVIGDIDELNSWLGKISVELKKAGALTDLLQFSLNIQQQLFNLGAELAILAADKRENSPSIVQAHIDSLEHHLDSMNAELPTLTSFILPGGNELSTTIHITRAVCRRAEPLKPETMSYLNRLSDWLFVLARFVCHHYKINETLWVSSQQLDPAS